MIPHANFNLFDETCTPEKLPGRVAIVQVASNWFEPFVRFVVL